MHFRSARWPFLELNFKYTKGTGRVSANPQGAVPKINWINPGLIKTKFTAKKLTVISQEKMQVEIMLPAIVKTVLQHNESVLTQKERTTTTTTTTV